MLASHVDLTPSSAAALGEAITGARSVRIVGTQSLSARTQSPPGSARVVSTAALTDIDIQPLDLVARVHAGVPLADLHAGLREHGLVWPVERLEPGGTVGGLIASGRGSAARAADFPARRWVLGATIMLASGEPIEVGGATVKNSAGYGLTHAMWGSVGRIGALMAVTLRLRHVASEDDSAADRGRGMTRVLAMPCEVRAEELPAGWDESEWQAVAPARPRVVAADCTRALIGCPNVTTAYKVAGEIQRWGGWAAIDRPPEPALAPDAWGPLTTALDPDGRLV